MISIKNFFTLFILSLGLFVVYKLLTQGYLLLGLVTTCLWALTTIIFLVKRAFPYRFMYPGLLTFFLFMVIPILFTIYISFTNLGTGHLLSLTRVKEILLSEKHTLENTPSYNFHLYPQNNNLYLIHVYNEEEKEHFLGQFDISKENKSVNLKPMSPPEFVKPPLTRGEVFNYFDSLSPIDFLIPNRPSVKIASTNYMASIINRYELKENDKILDTVTQTLYWPDFTSGFYTDGKENIAPGFFVNVGFSNFLKLFTNKSMKKPFAKVITWTLLWSCCSVFLTFCLGIFLALFVNSKHFKGKFIYRILIIIPYSIPFFISVLIFKGLYNKDYGIINDIFFYFFNYKIDWLGNALWAKVSCLLVNLWLGFPYMFLITTGILQSIPNSVYEAASMDGAGKFLTFRKITLPLVMSAVAPLLVGSFAFNLNNFVGIYLLTAGGPPMMEASTPVGETDILISYTYRLAFEGGRGQDFGMASAIALIIFIIIAFLTLINFKLSGMLNDKR